VTTLARMSGAGGSSTGHQVSALPDGARRLLARLHEECDRQVPFSQSKALLREAAQAIERLETEVARLAAERAGERAARQAP
jgi:hypothetical protein